MGALSGLSFYVVGFALAGAVAAVGPVLIHLLNRRRYRVVDWAAMDFLREAVRRSRRIVQLRDLVLLALRTLAVLLFGLAMARPYLSTSTRPVGRGEPVHAVLLLDNSLSMGYQQLDGTLLDAARTRAREFIDLLPEGSRISVIPTCSSEGSFSWDAYRTKDDARAALDAIQVVDRSTSAVQAAERALAACRQVEDVATKRVVFLGDQQAINWLSGVAAVYGDLPEMQVVPVVADRPENAWIADFKLQDGIADVETPAILLATVRYDGAAPRPGVQVTLTVDGVQAASRTLDLEPGQAREVSFGYRFDTPPEAGSMGFASAEVSLTPDRLPADDRRYLSVPLVAALPVVFVDQLGEGEDPSKNQYGETFRLRRLLAPVTSRADTARQLVQVRRATIDKLDRELLQDARLVVMAGVPRPDGAVTLLREYVQQGGQLLIAAGGDFDPIAWNQAGWAEGAGILPAPLSPQPIGRLPDETNGSLQPFFLTVEGLVHDYFLIDQVPPDELADLYRLPYFFKAVSANASDEVVASLVESETRRIEEERRFLAESDRRLAQWDEKERRGDLTDEERLLWEHDQERRAELAPRWLTWARTPAASERTLPAEKLAREGRPRVLATYTNQAPFMIERRIGRGQVLFVTSGIQGDWNTLTRTNAVVLYDRILRAMLERTLPRRNFASVEQIELPIEADERRGRFLLRRPDQTVEEPLLVEALAADQHGVAIRDVDQRGSYRVTALRPESAANEGLDERLWEAPLAVNGPEAESQLATLDEAELHERTGDAKIRWVPPGSPISLEGAAVRGENFWKWLMGAALACLLLELALLAVWGRPASASAPEAAR